jgi:hypothetical protein
MAAPKLRAGTLAPFALAALALGSACYSTTPHRATAGTQVASGDCAATITDVFARSGFVQLPTPAHLSMFFGARMAGPYSSFLRTGSGVGVTIDPADQAAGSCHVTLEALSPDVGCPGGQAGPSGTLNCQRLDAPGSPTGGYGVTSGMPCPTVPLLACELSYAPGADNDAAVDELARRVQAALGPNGRVN